MFIKLNKSQIFILIRSFLLFLLLVGALALYIIDNSIEEQQLLERNNKLETVHNLAVDQISHAFENFIALVAGMQSHLKNLDEFPSAAKLQDFLKDQLEDLDYRDSLVVSYIDTTHTFRYSFTHSEMDPARLAGTRLDEIRDESRIKEIDGLIRDGKLYMMSPLNLKEGWVGVSLIFGVKSQGVFTGYIASLLNLKAVLDRIYKTEISEEFVFRFTTGGHHFDRYTVHDGSKVYHSRSDPEYFQNYQLDPQSFMTSELSIHGLDLQLGTAYKLPFTRSWHFSILLGGWYLLLFLFAGLVLWEVYYHKTRSQEETGLKEQAIEALFDNAPIPILEEDFSRLKDYFDDLKASGVRDFRDYFTQAPQEVKKLASQVKFTRINKKSYEFFGIEKASEILRTLPHWFVEESWETFTEELIALAEGESDFESEIRVLGPSGKKIDLFMKLTVPLQYRDTLERVLVSFVNITDSKHAKANQLRALQEGEIIERKRIAQELHDSLGQHLAVSKMMFNAMDIESETLDPENLYYFRKGQDLLDESINEARSISHALMPATLESFGLAAAIEQLCELLMKNKTISAQLKSDLVEDEFDPILKIGLFRIVQELTTNIIKHAGAREISISLQQNDHTVFLMVSDNGSGFDGNIEDMKRRGIGLQNITSRVEALQGKFTLNSSKTGTIVSIKIPTNNLS